MPSRLTKSREPVRKAHRAENQHKTLRAFQVGAGLPTIPVMMAEIEDYMDVLMGRVEPPIKGPLSMMEVASAYHARAQELTMLLQKAEREGTVLRGSGHQKFRTGELRTFVEICKGAAELGSRRLSAQQLEFDQARYGRDLR